MTDEQRHQLGKWGPLVGVAVALVAAMPVLQFAAQHVPGVVSWLMFNSQVLWGVSYVRNGAGTLAFGVLFSLFWPLALSVRYLGKPSMPSERAQASTRFATVGVCFALGCLLDSSMTGVIFAVSYAMASPFLAMIALRFVAKRSWYRPMALQPTPAEGHAVMERAAQAAAPTTYTPPET